VRQKMEFDRLYDKNDESYKILCFCHVMNNIGFALKEKLNRLISVLVCTIGVSGFIVRYVQEPKFCYVRCPHC
jgi:hypothetical protein